MLVESLTAHRPTSLQPDEQAGQQLKGEDEVPPPLLPRNNRILNPYTLGPG
jgi:hypothetical protein